jgi:6-phosphofructokinase 1
VLPNANDSIYCDNLSRYAVHAAMAGKTDLVIGQWHNVFTHVPMPLAIAQRKTIHPRSSLWLSVLEATGQPASMHYPAGPAAAPGA